MTKGADGESRTATEPGAITGLLQAWGGGNLKARDDLVPLVYRELRRRAGAYLRRERPDHTLQPTALVHEAYARLVGQQRVSWQNRAQFFGVAAQMMRPDPGRSCTSAPRRKTARQGPEGVTRRSPRRRPASRLRTAAARPGVGRAGQFRRPARTDCGIAILRRGLSEQEVAVVLSLSRATVTREWQTARAWLFIDE